MNRGELFDLVERIDPVTIYGKVRDIVGLVIESVGPAEVALGELCMVGDPLGEHISAEVVGFRGDRVLLMPLSEIEGIRPGTGVFPTRTSLKIPVADSLQGRVVDALGQPMDDEGAIHALEHRSVHGRAPDPMQRARVSEPMGTGVRAIDGLATIGKGQRMGIFAGSGVGKSTLLGMIARNSEADVNVIALVGERGKEVLDFIEDSLGDEGRRRSVVVVATSEQPALIRLKAALTATTIAEYFRDQGKNVMLMMDSVTRVAMAQREIGLAAGEPPTTKGYTPSVFALLPRLLERAGNTVKGSITGLYTVLVEGDEMDDPIADSTRAILDGHMVLSRRLASRGHYPPVDVMESISRSMKDVVSPAHWERTLEIKSLLAAYAEAEDLVNIGAYARGSNPRIDRALDFIEPIEGFLKQGSDDAGTLDHHVQRFMGLLEPPPPPPEPPRRYQRMRRFQFRFQRVLDVKTRLEDVRKAALGQVVGACESERRELERLRSDHDAQVATERPAQGRVDPAVLNLLADYGHRLERESGEQGEQVRLAEALVEEKRAELMEATRARRTFEILQERAEAEHNKTARRQERAQLDEVGGQLHQRRQRAGGEETQDDEQAIGRPVPTQTGRNRTWH